MFLKAKCTPWQMGRSKSDNLILSLISIVACVSASWTAEYDHKTPNRHQTDLHIVAIDTAQPKQQI